MAGALAAYPANLVDLEQLAEKDPDNYVAHRQVCFIREKIGDVLRAQGRLEEALSVYRANLELAGLEITRPLTRTHLIGQLYAAE